MVVYLRSSREATKQKTTYGTGLRTLNPVWNKSMPFSNLKYDGEDVLVFELKGRKSLGENPTLGEFSITVKEVMLLSSTTASSIMPFNFTNKADLADIKVFLSFDLYPSLPPNLDDSNVVVMEGNLTHIKKARSGSVYDRLTNAEKDAGKGNGGGGNQQQQAGERDLAYLNVNQTYSCLLFDCGLEYTRNKPSPSVMKKRTSTQTFFTENPYSKPGDGADADSGVSTA
jgi:hypothetical protein